MQERLQKILARANFGSRRSCEDLIRDGRVSVNGQIAILGQKADLDRDTVAVDGQVIHVDTNFVYIILNKPQNVLSDERDKPNRPYQTARELIPVEGHLFPVGRLDLRSEGLLLFTDDGQLANLLTHPRYEHSKEYMVLVEGTPQPGTLQKWRNGLMLDGQRTAPAEIKVEKQEPGGSWLRVVLREGKKRQIRRVAAMLEHPVRRIIRVRIGPIQLGNLAPGDWRHLRSGEVKQLQEIKKNKKIRKR
jgi:pseudouridine synthase